MWQMHIDGRVFHLIHITRVRHDHLGDTNDGGGGDGNGGDGNGGGGDTQKVPPPPEKNHN